MSSAWDGAVLKKLKALLGKGLSTAEIGKRLGISKNAVVGKLHRLGWNVAANESTKAKSKSKSKTAAGAKKATPGVKAAVKSGANKSKTVAAKTEKTKSGAAATKKTGDASAKKTGTTKDAAKATSVHQRIVQHSLEMANLKPNQCRWPIGDPDSESFHFCGRQVFVGKPYCYEHCRQAYQFTAPKKK